MSDVHVRHDFYPRSPCGERRAARFTPTASRNFYPRSPCGERLSTSIIGFSGRVFLSTLSLRRATVNGDVLSSCFVNFYPRSPCGERRTRTGPALRGPYFYPRSPCGERPEIVSRSSMSCQFLSTLSLRRATQCHRPRPRRPFISIHALLAESDRHGDGIAKINFAFLSTLSLRRATGCPGGKNAVILHFYPRSPCGERLSFIIYSITDNCISIHALLAESDIELAFLAINPITFLSTLSLRRATPGAKSTTPERYYFYPRSPCGERPVTARIIDPTYDFYPRSPCGERRRQRPGS